MTDLVKVIGAATVSAVLLAAGLYVLLHGDYDADLQKAATGWIGVILGFWLR